MVKFLFYVCFTTIRTEIPRAAALALAVSGRAELGVGARLCVRVRAGGAVGDSQEGQPNTQTVLGPLLSGTAEGKIN